MVSRGVSRLTRVHVCVLLVLVGAFLYRFLEPVFYNDHFEHLSMAAEIVAGEVPGVDFFDPGRPLQYYLSALGLWLFGHQMLAEAVLCVGLLAVAVAIVFMLGHTITGSLLLGLFAATLVTGMLPRLYAYPKVLVAALALLACWRYLDRPTPWRIVGMGMATAVAFFFRYDYALYVGCAVVVAVVACERLRWRRLAGSAAVYAGVLALTCGPYVASMELSSGPGTGRLRRLLGGEDLVTVRVPVPAPGRPLLSWRPAGPLVSVRWAPEVDAAARLARQQAYLLHPLRQVGERSWQYVMTDPSVAVVRRLLLDPGVEDTANIDRAAGRIVRDAPWTVALRWLRLPVLESAWLTEDNAAIWLYDLFMLTLVASVARIVWRPEHPTETAKVLVTVTLGLTFCLFLVRGNLDSRLPDVVVPFAVLWAWMLRGRWRDARQALRTVRARSAASRTVAGAFARVSIATVLVASVYLAVDTYAAPFNQLIRTELVSSPRRVAARARTIVETLLADPLTQYAPAGSSGLRAMTRYLHECTQPTDRLLVVGYQPEVYFYANRRFGGGIVAFHANLGAASAAQATLIATLEREDVPIVIVPVDQLDELQQVYQDVSRYLGDRYHVVTDTGFGEARQFRVLVDRRLVPVSTSEEWGLPCFGPSRAGATHDVWSTGV